MDYTDCWMVHHLPVCVRMCRFNKLGRSNALPHTSHGNRARSPRVGRAFGEIRGIVIELSIKSPALLAADDDVDDSPDTDLCSSSPADVGETGNSTRDNSDIDRSSGDSGKLMNRLVSSSSVYSAEFFCYFMLWVWSQAKIWLTSMPALHMSVIKRQKVHDTDIFPNLVLIEFLSNVIYWPKHFCMKPTLTTFHYRQLESRIFLHLNQTRQTTYVKYRNRIELAHMILNFQLGSCVMAASKLQFAVQSISTAT